MTAANRDPLTSAQARVLEAITRMTNAKGYPPSVKEVADDLGYSGGNAVFEHVTRLKRKGYLIKTHLVARGLIAIN